MTRTAVTALIAVLLALTGCGPDPEPPPPPPVPQELVGAWNMITERGNGFSYEISERGVYVHVGIMRDGTQQYTLQETGGVAVSGAEITFTPESVTVSRSDTSLPAENHSSATAKPPRVLTWAVTGNELALTENGRTSTYQRE